MFHSSVPGRLSLSSASDRCVSLGGQLATVGQLYLAWRAGLDSCAPGWLSDGSVRYPVTWPRPDCGGSQPGVRTVKPNNTADNTTALYDAYCYRGKRKTMRCLFVNQILFYCFIIERFDNTKHEYSESIASSQHEMVLTLKSVNQK